MDIGELVLDGFERLDPDRVSAAFEAELSRLVRERGVPLAADGGQALDALSGLPPLPSTTSPAAARRGAGACGARGTLGAGRVTR